MRMMLGLLTGMTLCAAAPAQQVATHALPSEISYPEGIAYDPAKGVIYTASAADGAVARTDLATGRSTVIVPAGTLLPGNESFPGLLGMKLDASNRLWIAGGRTGRIFVIDTANGAVVKSFDTGAAGSLLNDVAFTADAAYFTDTLRPIVWRVPIGADGIGELESWLPLDKSPIEYGEGPNLNGIAVAADGKTLIVGQMNKGLLYRIDPTSRAIAPIPLEGGEVTGADGLVVDGNSLYLVRQPHAEVVAIALDPGLASARVVKRFSDPALKWPATAAKAGDRLLVVNAQFNKRSSQDPELPFSVASVPLSALAP